MIIERSTPVGDLADTVELSREFRAAHEIVQHVETIGFVVDEIRQPALSPFIDFANFRILLDQGLEFLLDFRNALFSKRQGEDKDCLVRTFDCGHKLHLLMV